MPFYRFCKQKRLDGPSKYLIEYLPQGDFSPQNLSNDTLFYSSSPAKNFTVSSQLKHNTFGSLYFFEIITRYRSPFVDRGIAKIVKEHHLFCILMTFKIRRLTIWIQLEFSSYPHTLTMSKRPQALENTPTTLH